LKSLTELFPYFQTVFFKCSFAGFFKTVDLVDQPTLMVSPEQIYESWKPQFVRKKEGYHLYVILVPIYIITLEQILFMRWWANLIEKAY